MERNIRLLIEYDGSRYDGWQRLGKGHGVTIQGKLEDVLSKMTGEQVETFRHIVHTIDRNIPGKISIQIILHLPAFHIAVGMEIRHLLISWM